MKRNFEIAQESKRQELVKLSTENARSEADAKAYSIKVMMEAMEQADTNLVQALAQTGMSPDQMIANAFQGLAANAERIGELNIAPDLLKQLIKE